MKCGKNGNSRNDQKDDDFSFTQEARMLSEEIHAVPLFHDWERAQIIWCVFRLKNAQKLGVFLDCSDVQCLRHLVGQQLCSHLMLEESL